MMGISEPHSGKEEKRERNLNTNRILAAFVFSCPAGGGVAWVAVGFTRSLGIPLRSPPLRRGRAGRAVSGRRPRSQAMDRGLPCRAFRLADCRGVAWRP